jgi:hypothetical protein
LRLARGILFNLYNKTEKLDLYENRLKEIGKFDNLQEL